MFLTYFLPIGSMTYTYARVGIELWGSQSIGECTQRQLDNIKSKRRVSIDGMVHLRLKFSYYIPWYMIEVFLKQLKKNISLWTKKKNTLLFCVQKQIWIMLTECFPTINFYIFHFFFIFFFVSCTWWVYLFESLWAVCFSFYTQPRAAGWLQHALFMLFCFRAYFRRTSNIIFHPMKFWYGAARQRIGFSVPLYMRAVT